MTTKDKLFLIISLFLFWLAVIAFRQNSELTKKIEKARIDTLSPNGGR